MSGWHCPVIGWAMPLPDTIKAGPYRVDADVGELVVCMDLLRMQGTTPVERYLRTWPVGTLALHEAPVEGVRVFTLWVRAKGGARRVEAARDSGNARAFKGDLGPLVALRDLPRDGQWHAGILASPKVAS